MRSFGDLVQIYNSVIFHKLNFHSICTETQKNIPALHQYDVTAKDNKGTPQL